MAGPEAQPTSQSRESEGKYWRNIGFGLLAVGVLGEIALLVAAGAGLAVSGEIYNRANRPKQK